VTRYCSRRGAGVKRKMCVGAVGERYETNNKTMPTRRPFSSKFWTLLQHYVTNNIGYQKRDLQLRLAVELYYFFGR
jgi:hypothetical protein